MKYLFGLFCLLAAGFLLCAGFYGYQRVMIQMDLQTKLPSHNTLVPKNEEEKQLKEQMDALLAQESEQLKRIAKNSATHKEFQQKSEELLLQWAREDKMGKIMQAYKDRALNQAETVAP